MTSSDPSDAVQVEREKSAAALALEHAEAMSTRAAEELKRAHDLNLEAEKTLNLLEQADLTEDRESRAKHHEKILEVAGGSVERARDSAKFIQTAAGALITAYAALLALVFSVDGKTLPLRAIYATGFLGVAIASAIGYLAFLTKPQPVPAYETADSYATTQINRTVAFVAWINSGVGNRQAFLRTAVIAFFVGVAFIPAAFIGPTGSSSAASASTPEPPAAPERVPAALAQDAARLYKYQVDAYLDAVTPTMTDEGIASEEGPAEVEECKSPVSVARACGWRTEDAVERSFRWIALAGVLVVLLPFGWWVFGHVPANQKRAVSAAAILGAGIVIGLVVA